MSCIETVGVLVDKDWSKAEMDGELSDGSQSCFISWHGYLGSRAWV